MVEIEFALKINEILGFNALFFTFFVISRVLTVFKGKFGKNTHQKTLKILKLNLRNKTQTTENNTSVKTYSTTCREGLPTKRLRKKT